MILHVWTVLCARSVIDIESQNVSIQNVIEQLTISNDPEPDGRIAIPMELVSFWARREPDTPATGEAQISFYLPSGEKKELLVFPIDLVKHSRARIRIRIPELSIPEGGRYQFCTEYRNDEKDSWILVSQVPLDIVFQEETEEEE